MFRRMCNYGACLMALKLCKASELSSLVCFRVSNSKVVICFVQYYCIPLGKNMFPLLTKGGVMQRAHEECMFSSQSSLESVMEQNIKKGFVQNLIMMNLVDL
jgi:hypothetical protein